MTAVEEVSVVPPTGATLGVVVVPMGVGAAVALVLGAAVPVGVVAGALPPVPVLVPLPVAVPARVSGMPTWWGETVLPVAAVGTRLMDSGLVPEPVSLHC